MERHLKRDGTINDLRKVVPDFGVYTGFFTAGRNLALMAVIGLSVLLFVGCQTKPKKAPLPLAQAPTELTVGDVVRITFPAAPELNQSQKIGTDGSLSLPLVGQVHAAGKTPGALQAELSNLYKSQLQDSETVVSVESRAIPVVVSGAVQKPGKRLF